MHQIYDAPYTKVETVKKFATTLIPFGKILPILYLTHYPQVCYEWISFRNQFLTRVSLTGNLSNSNLGASFNPFLFLLYLSVLVLHFYPSPNS